VPTTGVGEVAGGAAQATTARAAAKSIVDRELLNIVDRGGDLIQVFVEPSDDVS